MGKAKKPPPLLQFLCGCYSTDVRLHFLRIVLIKLGFASSYAFFILCFEFDVIITITYVGAKCSVILFSLKTICKTSITTLVKNMLSKTHEL